MPPYPAAFADQILTGWKSLESKHGFTLRYLALGTGSQTWIAFHGFGQRPEDLIAWAEPLLALGNRMILVELPWHGQSTGLGDDMPITQEEWAQLFSQLVRKEQVLTFRLFGFSLGARLALLTAYQMKAKVEQLVLCAPDGVTNSVWFSLATGTALGRRLFRNVVENPAPLFRITRLLHQFGLLNRSLKRFVEKELTNTRRRKLVYQSWLSLRLMPPPAVDVAGVINKWSIPVVMFFGRHDRIIPIRRGRPLIRALRHCQVHLLDCGHNTLPILAGKILASLQP